MNKEGKLPIGDREGKKVSSEKTLDMETRMALRDVTYVPGLLNIFNEILVNASDNKRRDPKYNFFPHYYF